MRRIIPLFIVLLMLTTTANAYTSAVLRQINDALINVTGDSLGVVVPGDTVWLTPIGLYWEPASPLDSALLDSVANAKGRFSGAGGGAALSVEEGDSEVDDAVVVLDFGAGFDVSETPAHEMNITLDLTEKQVSLTTEVTGTLPDGNVANNITVDEASDVDTSGTKINAALEGRVASATMTLYGVVFAAGADTIVSTGVWPNGKFLVGRGAGQYPLLAAMSGDGSLDALGALTVNDDSHAHTTTTISGLVDVDMANDALDPDKIVGDATDNNLLDSNVIAIVNMAERDASGNVISSTYETITEVAKIGDDTTAFKTASDSTTAWDNRGYSTATTTALGIASFNGTNFSALGGDISIASGGVNSGNIANNSIDTVDIDKAKFGKFIRDTIAAGITMTGGIDMGDNDITNAERMEADSFYISTVDPDSALMTKKYIDDAAGGLTDQAVKGDHVDSTAENFVFDGAYHVTSAESDSAYITIETLEDTAALRLLKAGGQMTGNLTFSGAQTVDGVDISALDADIAADSLSWNATADALGTSIGTSEIENGAIYENKLNVSNEPVDNWILSSNSGAGNFTWVPYAWEGIAGATADTARWIPPSGDTAIVFVSDRAGNNILTVGKELNGSAQTLRIKADTFDISGDVIADFAGNNLTVASGVLDVDVLDTLTTTINHTQWDEHIKDNVGDMVTGNTETGIVVTYDDADNTLDFVITDTLHFIFAILNPNATYDTDVRFCFKPVLSAAITITRIDVTCDAVPGTEPAMSLKYADAFIGLANAVTIDVITTTNGVTEITSGFDDATIPTGKALYFESLADPEAALKSITVDMAYTVD